MPRATTGAARTQEARRYRDPPVIDEVHVRLPQPSRHTAQRALVLADLRVVFVPVPKASCTSLKATSATAETSSAADDSVPLSVARLPTAPKIVSTPAMATDVATLTRLGTRPKPIEYIQSLWDRRHLAVEIPRASLDAEHYNTALGGVWHVLNPLFLVGVYYLIFDVVMGISRGMENFVGFLAIGVFTWHFTTRCIQSGSRAISANEGLLRAVAFPRAILPVSVVLGEFFSFGYALGAMYVIVLVTGETPGLTWLVVPLLMVVQMVFNMGFALGIARVADHIRDVQQVLPYSLRIWGYSSGIFYDVTQRAADHPLILSIMEFNPAFLFMHLSRRALLENSSPTLREWTILVGWALVALVVGFLFFMRREHEYGRG
jgi:teichoic acid transport system permease protein